MQHYNPLNYRFKLPDIARPGVSQQPLNSAGGKSTSDFLVVILGVSFKKISCEARDIIQSLT
jgi:hypothetical protein